MDESLIVSLLLLLHLVFRRFASGLMKDRLINELSTLSFFHAVPFGWQKIRNGLEFLWRDTDWIRTLEHIGQKPIHLTRMLIDFCCYSSPLLLPLARIYPRYHTTWIFLSFWSANFLWWLHTTDGLKKMASIREAEKNEERWRERLHREKEIQFAIYCLTDFYSQWFFYCKRKISLVLDDDDDEDDGYIKLMPFNLITFKKHFHIFCKQPNRRLNAIWPKHSTEDGMNLALFAMKKAHTQSSSRDPFTIFLEHVFHRLTSLFIPILHCLYAGTVTWFN